MKIQDTIQYIKDLKKSLILSGSLFLGAALLGIIFALTSPEQVELFLNSLKDSIGALLQLPPLNLAFAIFFNNVIKTIIMIFAGIILGIYPALSLAANGYILGVISYTAILQEGILTFFASIVPHGIIELPIIILGGAVGLHFGAMAFRKITKKTDEHFKQEYIKATQLVLKIVIPGLLLAAFIESFITPIFISLVAGS
jgi:stage II sporulation protein M